MGSVSNEKETAVTQETREKSVPVREEKENKKPEKKSVFPKLIMVAAVVAMIAAGVLLKEK